MKILKPTLPVVALLLASCSGTKISKEALQSSGTPATRATLADHATDEALDILPKKWDLANVFDVYNTLHDKRIGAAWARNWTSDVDLTGVAWDASEAGTLVSPQHILMAGHASRAEGDKLAFHDKDGTIHVRTVVEVRRLTSTWRQDVAVGLLDEEVPVKHYSVLPPEADYKDLEGALVFPTTSRLNLLAARVHKVKDAGVYLSHDPELPKFWQRQLVQGDSGNPTFILVEDEPVLLSTHSLGGAGAGPMLAHPVNYDAINRAMKSMGGGGHQLQTVALTGAAPYVPSAPRVTQARLPAFRVKTPSKPTNAHAGHDHSGHSHAGHDHSGHSHAGHNHAAHATPTSAAAPTPVIKETTNSHAGHDHSGHAHAQAGAAVAENHDYAAVPMPSSVANVSASAAPPSAATVKSETLPAMNLDASSSTIPTASDVASSVLSTANAGGAAAQ